MGEGGSKPGGSGPAFDLPDLEVPSSPSRSKMRAVRPAQEAAPVSRQQSTIPAHASPASGAEVKADAMDQYFGAGVFDEENLGGGPSPGALELGDSSAHTTGGSTGQVGGGPELDLGAQSVPAAPPAAGATSDDYFGSGVLDDELEGFDQGNAMALSVDTGFQEPEQGGAGPAPGSQVWPTGKTPDPEDLAVDPVEVQLEADFGEAPTNPVLAPVYSFRVFTRQRQLQTQLEEDQRTQTRIEQERDQLLARLVREVRPELEANQSMRRHLEAVVGIEQLAASRGETVANVEAEYDEKNAAIQGDLELAQQQALALQEDIPALASQLGEQDETFQREQARLKRLHIEYRSLREVAERAQSAGQQPPPENLQRMHELAAIAAQAKPGVEALKLAADGARANVEDARGHLADLEQRMAGLNRARGTLDADFEKQAGVRGEGLSAAQLELETAMAEAGRAVLATRGGVDIVPEALEAITAGDVEVTHAAGLAQRTRLALDAYDPKVFKLGKTLAAVGAGLLLVLIVAAIYALMSGGKPGAGPGDTQRPPSGEEADENLMEDF